MDFDLIAKISNWLWVVLTGAIGWLVKRLNAIEGKAISAQKDINDHKILVASSYVTRQEFTDSIHRIDVKLDRILDRLDRKRDK